MEIYPYHPLKSLAANLWQVEGSLANGLPRNMTVYRLPDGRLLLYSVVAMQAADMEALENLGRPAIMVMPHDRHQMDAPFYKRRYPDLRTLAPDPGIHGRSRSTVTSASSERWESRPTFCRGPRITRSFWSSPSKAGKMGKMGKVGKVGKAGKAGNVGCQASPFVRRSSWETCPNFPA